MYGGVGKKIYLESELERLDRENKEIKAKLKMFNTELDRVLLEKTGKRGKNKKDLHGNTFKLLLRTQKEINLIKAELQNSQSSQMESQFKILEEIQILKQQEKQLKLENQSFQNTELFALTARKRELKHLISEEILLISKLQTFNTEKKQKNSVLHENISKITQRIKILKEKNKATKSALQSLSQAHSDLLKTSESELFSLQSLLKTRNNSCRVSILRIKSKNREFHSKPKSKTPEF